MPYAHATHQSSLGVVPFPITTMRQHIGVGERGNFQTIAAARRLINGKEGSSAWLVRQTAIDVTMGCARDDAQGKVAALKGFLATIPFVPDDFGNQVLFSPELSLKMHFLRRHEIACASIAVLGAALARACGLLPAFMVLAFVNGPPIFTHIYAVACDPEGNGAWFDLDSTNEDQRGDRTAPIARWRMIPI
jgi:hypothetical protein